MKAVVYTRYGEPDVLQVREIARPVPSDHEVLIKVRAATVNRTDLATIKAKRFFMRAFTGLLKPKKQTPGTEFAGRVEAVGTAVTSFKVGDSVFGFDDRGSGSQAEYMTISEEQGLIIMPADVTYAQAAASTEGTHYAYNFINKVNTKSGQEVLVNGATGAIGSAAVQLLKSFGLRVTAVCGTSGTELIQSLGADRVIDYTREDFTRTKERYDFVFDTVGKSSFFKCRRLLKPGGVYISSDLGFLAQNVFLPMITPIIRPMTGNRTTRFPTPKNVKETLVSVKGLIEEGRFRAVIDREYPLERIVDAYKYVETGQKIGSVVVTIRPDSQA